jgi:L-alanine-DL-glutamate epimerase-like enolase superfamily enzyme
MPLTDLTGLPADENPRIADLTATVHRVPLPRPWGPDRRDVHVVASTVTDSLGRTGHGFSWMPTVGGVAVHAMVTSDCAAAVRGLPAEPELVWDRLWRHLHEAGSGGVTTLALAAVDTALWDLRGVVTGQSLVRRLGRRRDSVPVYGSGVNRHYPLDELEEQARRWVAAGFGAVKMKVGRPDLDEDVERVAAVRRIIGDRRGLMVDANQLWDLPAARRALAVLRRFDLAWIEEPLLADDLRAHAALRRSIDVPVALGENLHTVYQFREALLLEACDVVQPNVVRVGGITPFLRIVEVARAHGAAVAPHLLPDVSGQLAMCLPDEVWIEDVEDASLAAIGVLERPAVTISDGRLWTSEERPGLGLRVRAPD